jgi:hypothetical protein
MIFIVRIGILIAILLATACAHTDKLRQADLARIAEWLPGEYSNAAQVDEDLKRVVVDVHEPIGMTIVHVFAPFIGDLVFYVEQADAMNPRRIVSQRLYRFDKSADGKTIVQTSMDFKEPERWVHGQQRVDIFRSLLPVDVLTAPGCDLAWTFDGQMFKGANLPAACRMTARESGQRVNTEMRMELDEHELRMAERQFGVEGKLVSGRRTDEFFRFERVGSR